MQVFHQQCNPCNTKGTSGKHRAVIKNSSTLWHRGRVQHWYVHKSPCEGGVPATYHVRAEQKLRTPHPTGRLIRGVSGSNAEFARGFGLRNDGQEYLIHKNWANCWKGSLRSHVRKDCSMSQLCIFFVLNMLIRIIHTRVGTHLPQPDRRNHRNHRGGVPKAVELIVAWFHLTPRNLVQEA